MRAIVLIGLLCLSACGFAPRGALDLPAGIDRIYVGGHDSNGEMATQLRALLRGNGVKVTRSPAESSLSIILLAADSGKRTLSLDNQARAAEYLLTESAVFEVRDSQGKVLIPQRELREQRVMTNDPDNVVSKAEEERLLRDAMRDSLAAQLARQMRNLPEAGNDTADAPAS